MLTQNKKIHNLTTTTSIRFLNLKLFTKKKKYIS